MYVKDIVGESFVSSKISFCRQAIFRSQSTLLHCSRKIRNKNGKGRYVYVTQLFTEYVEENGYSPQG